VCCNLGNWASFRSELLICNNAGAIILNRPRLILERRNREIEAKRSALGVSGQGRIAERYRSAHVRSVVLVKIVEYALKDCYVLSVRIHGNAPSELEQHGKYHAEIATANSFHVVYSF
jgi:hypothetical protein